MPCYHAQLYTVITSIVRVFLFSAALSTTLNPQSYTLNYYHERLPNNPEPSILDSKPLSRRVATSRVLLLAQACGGRNHGPGIQRAPAFISPSVLLGLPYPSRYLLYRVLEPLGPYRVGTWRVRVLGLGFRVPVFLEAGSCKSSGLFLPWAGRVH